MSGTESMEDSDSMPLDGDTPLTPAERKALRRIIRDDERATWARKKLGVLIPVMVAFVTACWQAWDWLVKHVKFTP